MNTSRLFLVLTITACWAAAVPCVSAQESGTASDTAAVRVVLHDGSVHTGRLESRTDSTLVLVTASGVRIAIPTREVRQFDFLEGRRHIRVDPNRSRLLFAPTARSLGHGSGYVGVYEIFFPFVAVGLRDVVTVAAGISLVPGVSEQLLYAAPKVTVYSSRRVHVAAGAIAGTLTNGSESGGVAFALGTYGTSEAAVTAGLGFGFIEDEVSSRPAVLLAGEYQLTDYIKLLSENYVFPGVDEGLVTSAGVRFFSDRLAADLGLFTMPSLVSAADGFPFIPWLGFTYNFGL